MLPPLIDTLIAFDARAFFAITFSIAALYFLRCCRSILFRFRFFIIFARRFQLISFRLF